MTLKELKKGALFTLKPFEGEPSDCLLWVKGDYDRSEKKFDCYKWEDINHETAMKGTRTIYEV